MPVSAQSLEDELIEDIAGFDCDPAGFVKYAYPWSESGELAEFQGDREWQFELLDVIGKHLRSPDRFTPLLVAVASGHGIGKSALVGQVISWGLSTCEDCRIQVSANTGDQAQNKDNLQSFRRFRLLINAPLCGMFPEK